MERERGAKLVVQKGIRGGNKSGKRQALTDYLR